MPFRRKSFDEMKLRNLSSQRGEICDGIGVNVERWGCYLQGNGSLRRWSRPAWVQICST